MFYRGHSFLCVLTLPRTGNRTRCYPMIHYMITSHKKFYDAKLRIKDPTPKQIRKAIPVITTEIRTFNHICLINFIINKSIIATTALRAPPIAPPTTGTISNNAGTFPQTNMSKNGKTHNAISYHFTEGESWISSPSATSFTPAK